MNKYFIIAVIYSFFMISCQSAKTGDDGHNHDEAGHEHAEEEVDPHAGHDHAEEEVDSHAGHDHSAEEVDPHAGHDHSADEADDNADKDHGDMKVYYQDFAKVIKTSGEILPAKGDEKVISAFHGGIVRLDSKQLYAGTEVNTNEVLLSLSGEGTADNSLKVHYQTAKTEYEMALQKKERLAELLADTIISQTSFQEAELEYQKAKINFDAVKNHYDENGHQVRAPFKGYIKEILVSEGQYVNAGDPVIIVSKTRKQLLRADIGQQYLSEMESLHCAKFLTPYNDKVYDTEELNGQLVSYGKALSESSYFVPVFIEMDYVEGLVPGTYLEVFLRIHDEKKALVIPKSAVLEEQGLHYVFAKWKGEYKKKYITISGYDGEFVAVSKGIREYEVIATENVYQLKLEGLSSSIPHGHSH